MTFLHHSWRVFYRVCAPFALAIAIGVHMLAHSADPKGTPLAHFMILTLVGLVAGFIASVALSWLLGKDFDP